MRNRFLIGLALLVIATVIIFIWQALPKPPPVITVNGTGGASKAGLLADADVKRILADKYKIAVNYKTLGGLASVCGLPPQDFLWPGTENSVQAFKNCGGKGTAESVLTSPLVFYTWQDVSDALEQHGWVENRGGVYYLNDMPGFMQMLVKGKSWKELGILLRGDSNVVVIPSDPTQSDSGALFAALMANMALGGRVATDTTIDQVLPGIKNYFGSLGYLYPKTGDLFEAFMVKGIPIIVAYESQLQDFATTKNYGCQELSRIRIIYPNPTVWASHPLLAETASGEKLQQALSDPQIQKFAWERHGFRTGLAGIPGGTVTMSCFQFPAAVASQMQLPKTEVMDHIVTNLGSPSAPGPALPPNTRASPTP